MFLGNDGCGSPTLGRCSDWNWLKRTKMADDYGVEAVLGVIHKERLIIC